MLRFLADHRAGARGSHEYSLERYGLEREALLERFQPYIDHFDVTVAR
jgi:hypothetical protein